MGMTKIASLLFFSILVVAVSAGFRFALDPLLHEKAVYLVFACGTIVAALYGGLWSGIASTILAIPVCDYFFIDPRHTWFLFDDRGDIVALILFCALGIASSMIVEQFHRTRQRLQSSELRLRTVSATIRSAIHGFGGRRMRLR